MLFCCYLTQITSCVGIKVLHYHFLLIKYQTSLFFSSGQLYHFKVYSCARYHAELSTKHVKAELKFCFLWSFFCFILVWVFLGVGVRGTLEISDALFS